jgi:hypothetical protein
VPGALEQKPLTIQFRPFLAHAGLFVAACDAFSFKTYPLDLAARPGTVGYLATVASSAWPSAVGISRT